MRTNRMFAMLAAVFMAVAPACAVAQAPASPTTTAVEKTQATAGWDATAPLTATVVAPQPAEPSAVVSAGSLAATVIEWVGTVLIPVLGAFLTKWLVALAKKAGVDASQAMSDRLDGMIENGLHDALNKAGADLTGKLTVDVKSQAIAGAVAYAQAHGADTIKALSGVDPTDPQVIATLQARAAKVLNGLAPAPTAAAAPAAAA